MTQKEAIEGLTEQMNALPMVRIVSMDTFTRSSGMLSFLDVQIIALVEEV